MMIYKLLFTLIALTVLPTTCWAQTTQRESAIKDNDRIVFIGDSITGQGAKGGKGGWIAMIGEGLNLARPEAKPTLTGLGGSGSTVGAWLNFDPTGHFLYSCNQRADNIAAFRVDQKTGGLAFAGHYNPVGNPSIIVFLDLARN